MPNTNFLRKCIDNYWYYQSLYPHWRLYTLDLVERMFKYNSEAVTMKGSYYINGTGGGWYHAE